MSEVNKIRLNKVIREFNISYKDDIKAALHDEWTKIQPGFPKT